MKKIFILYWLFLSVFSISAQVGIGTTSPDTSAILDISATDKGVLVPRVALNNVTTTMLDSNNIAATGLLIYNTNDTVTGGNGIGFYYFNGAQWKSFKDAEKIDDLSDGKSDNDGSNNGSSVFLGINAGFNDDGSHNRNVGIGFQSLLFNTIGSRNVGIGFQSLFNNLSGYDNTALGVQTLPNNQTGESNSATGAYALFHNTLGNSNTAYGAETLFTTTEGSFNTAVGIQAGYNNVNGNGSVFIGYRSGFGETNSNRLYIENSLADADNALIYGEFNNNILRTNSQFQIGNPTITGYAFPIVDGVTNQVLQTDGSGALTWVNGTDLGSQKINDLTDGKSDNDGTENGSSIFLGVNAGFNDNGINNQNVGIGFEALYTNISGYNNMGNGHQALYSNTTGFNNTANGSKALYNNQSGYSNSATGYQALFGNTTGINNTASGTNALYTNTDGSFNTANGWHALNNNISGQRNVANGAESLNTNTTGFNNSANGYQALYSNTIGINNTANGYRALLLNKANNNTANGSGALYSNITGINNTATGYEAGFNSTGGENVFIGYQSGYNETTASKLYIENSNADANNALIYGEFGIDSTSTDNILRTNSVFQIGNPTVTGFAFPIIDGTNNQVLQTDGSGALSWINGADLGAQKINDLTDGKSDANGSSLFLGIDAGAIDDGTDNLNVGIGFEALKDNTTGVKNTAIGFQALSNNQDGDSNSANGYQALFSNKEGSTNVANGAFALYNNFDGNFNTANGNHALYSNTEGSVNTASGHQALYKNTLGDRNVVTGSSALYMNETGEKNTATGYRAGYNSIGDKNVFIGFQSGYQEEGNSKLYISNDSTSHPLIYGEFSNDYIEFNGDANIDRAGITSGLTRKLSITGARGDGGADIGQLVFANYDSNSGNISYDAAKISTQNNGNNTDGDLRFWTNNNNGGLTERMIIKPTGEIGMGTSNPIYDLHVGDGTLGASNQSNTRATVSDNSNGERAAFISLARETDGSKVEGQLEANGSNSAGPSVIVGSSTVHPLFLRTGNITRMTVATNGNVGINTGSPNFKLEVNGSAAKTGGGAWSNPSDRRLKENIHSFNAGLEKLIKINPVVFNYTLHSGLSNGKEQVGVVAQELQEIAPYMIEKFEKDGEEYLAVNNSAMVYMLINSVKELNQKIENLEAEIEKIKLDKNQ